MEEWNSIWSYQESVQDLKQKLLSTTFELENMKLEAGEAMRKNKEDVKHLIQFLEMICQERDEARNQLQTLLSQLFPSADFSQPNRPSDTNTYHSHSFPPWGPFLDTVTSPEFKRIDAYGLSSIAYLNPRLVQVGDIPMTDDACLVVENLVKGKALPQRGKYQKAMLDAGPLLETVLVAGPLPRWRNPPVLEKFHIPPVSIKATASNLSHIASRSMNSKPYADMSCAVSSPILPTSVLNVGNGTPESSIGDDMLIAACNNASCYFSLCKKQRLI